MGAANRTDSRRKRGTASTVATGQDKHRDRRPQLSPYVTQKRGRGLL